MRFPGRIIKKGEPNSSLVKRIQNELSNRGYGPFASGIYDAKMAAQVARFQSQNFDQSGQPLAIDGEIGPFTWGALFRVALQVAGKTSDLLRVTLDAAIAEIGQTEVPPGSNRGPRINQYLDSVGIPPEWGQASQRPWCAAFVFWCFKTGSNLIGAENPAFRNAGVLNCWRHYRQNRSAVTFTKDEALANPARIVPGTVFVHNYGSGQGHTGFVEEVLGDGRFVSVEGNVAKQGEPGREGVCVARVNRRRLTDEKLIGYFVL